MECVDAVFVLASNEAFDAEKAKDLVFEINHGKRNLDPEFRAAVIVLTEAGFRYRIAAAIVRPLGILLA
jgi:hypothetical protein